MGRIDSIKRVLPVSSRSYHQRTNELEEELGALRSVAESLSSRVGDLEKSVQMQTRALEETRRGYRGARSLYWVAEPGYPNYGDELIAAEWLRYVARVRPDVPVYVDCARPGPAAAILRNIHPHAVFVDTLARLTFELPTQEFEPEAAEGEEPCRAACIARAVVAALEDEGRAARYAAGIAVLRDEVRGVHYLGGGYMNGAWQENLARLALAPWARAKGLPVVGTGLGFAPLEGATAEFAQTCARSFTALTVRDRASFTALRAVDAVGLAPDDCFVNALEGVYRPDDGIPAVMVSVQGDMVEDKKALHRHVLAILTAWGVKPGSAVGVVECNPYIDCEIMPVLEAAGYTCLLYPAAHLMTQGFPARPGQLWISTRYHPHLLAAARGCSGCYIPLGSAYYRYKHEAVLRMGSHWTAAPIGEEIPDPGKGFESGDVRFEYQRRIRESACALYGM